MTDKLVQHVLSRKVRPVHPGEIILDILESREDIEFDINKYEEMLKGDRPITYEFAKEVEDRLGLKADLLMILQRKVDIWDSNNETN
jgi:plasmid maintenance system antidote protein VapI